MVDSLMAPLPRARLVRYRLADDRLIGWTLDGRRFSDTTQRAMLKNLGFAIEMVAADKEKGRTAYRIPDSVLVGEPAKHFDTSESTYWHRVLTHDYVVAVTRIVADAAAAEALPFLLNTRRVDTGAPSPLILQPDEWIPLQAGFAIRQGGDMLTAHALDETLRPRDMMLLANWLPLGVLLARETMCAQCAHGVAAAETGTCKCLSLCNGCYTRFARRMAKQGERKGTRVYHCTRCKKSGPGHFPIAPTPRVVDFYAVALDGTIVGIRYTGRLPAEVAAAAAQGEQQPLVRVPNWLPEPTNDEEEGEDD